MVPRKLWGLTFDLEAWVVKSFKKFNLEHFISSFVRIHILNRLSASAERYICYTYTSPTSYPGSFHYAPRWRKDPGPGWSRVSQILGDNKIFT